MQRDIWFLCLILALCVSCTLFEQGEVDTPPEGALSQAAKEARNKLDAPLVKAAALGKVSKVRRLLKKGEYVDQKANDGTTPLLWAAWVGNTKTVQVLLEFEADANVKSPRDWAALIPDEADVASATAASPPGDGQPGEELDFPVLNLAARQGHTAIVELLLDNGGYIESMSARMRPNGELGEGPLWGHNPMYEAIKHEHVEVVKLLLARGAYPDMQFGSGPYSHTLLSTATTQEIRKLIGDALMKLSD